MTDQKERIYTDQIEDLKNRLDMVLEDNAILQATIASLEDQVAELRDEVKDKNWYIEDLEFELGKERFRNG